eukprot:14805111-Alexandrium_andersonii.AAC.1
MHRQLRDAPLRHALSARHSQLAEGQDELVQQGTAEPRSSNGAPHRRMLARAQQHQADHAVLNLLHEAVARVQDGLHEPGRPDPRIAATALRAPPLHRQHVVAALLRLGKLRTPTQARQARPQ